MFYGLNEIDWARFGKHLSVKTESKDIPHWIHQLLSNDHETRIAAAGMLFGIQQHSGMIEAATPYIIPFVLEVLAQPHYSNKAYLLHKLRSVAYHMYISGKRFVAIRRAVATYDALLIGFPTYLQLLNDDDAETRFYCAKLLQYFQEQSIEVLDALMRRFQIEPHLRIRAVILRSMGNLMIDAFLNYDHQYDAYRKFIISTITSDTQGAVRFAAADVTTKMGREIETEESAAVEQAIREYQSGNSLQDDGDPLYFEPFT